MEAMCALCHEVPAEGYGHFYKDALGRIDNAHADDVMWCHACGEKTREKAEAIFSEIYGDFAGAIPCFCPVKGCGKVMLYEEGTELRSCCNKIILCFTKKQRLYCCSSSYQVYVKGGGAVTVS